MDRPAGPWTIDRIYRAYMDAVSAPQAKVSAKHILASFAHKRPEGLKQADVDAYIAQRSVDASEATYATELRYLRAALNWAHREAHINTPRPFKIPAGKSVRYRFYTKSEFDKMISASDTLRMRLFLELGIATASRPGKIYKLRWTDIDPIARVIYFEAGTANKRTRPVPINNRLAWALGVAYQARQSNYVIERNGKPVASLVKQFRKMADAAGIKDAKLRDLRGTAASWALQRGAPIAKVADLLGDSVEVVERHYGHFSPTHIQSVTDLLG